MSLIEAGIYDAVLFAITLAFGLFTALRGTSKYLKLFLVLYVFITYSSYNIMIKPIHDYNVVIPRNFIFHFQIKYLNVIDIFFLLLLFLFSIDLIGNRFRILIPKEKIFKIYNIIVLRDFLVFFVGLTGFLIYSHSIYSDTLHSVTDQIRQYRGILYFLVLYYILLKIINFEIHKYDFNFLFRRFLYINSINVSSGFIASKLYLPYVWQRYGFNITLIDQDDVMIANFYSCILLLSLFLLKRIKLPIIDKLLVALISLVYFFNFYKGFYVFMFLAFGYAIMLQIINKKYFIKQLALLIIIVVSSFNAMLWFATSKSIYTRISQVESYLNFIDDKSDLYLYLGIGAGGYYLSKVDTEDGGEVKKVDLEKNSDLKRVIQTPLLVTIKEAGLVGLSIFLFANYFLVYGIFKLRKCSTVIESSLIMVISFPIIFGFLLLLPTPVRAIFMIKATILLIRYQREKECLPLSSPSSNLVQNNWCAASSP